MLIVSLMSPRYPYLQVYVLSTIYLYPAASVPHSFTSSSGQTNSSSPFFLKRVADVLPNYGQSMVITWTVHHRILRYLITALVMMFNVFFVVPIIFFLATICRFPFSAFFITYRFSYTFPSVIQTPMLFQNQLKIRFTLYLSSFMYIQYKYEYYIIYIIPSGSGLS